MTRAKRYELEEELQKESNRITGLIIILAMVVIPSTFLGLGAHLGEKYMMPKYKIATKQEIKKREYNIFNLETKLNECVEKNMQLENKIEY